MKQKTTYVILSGWTNHLNGYAEIMQYLHIEHHCQVEMCDISRSVAQTLAIAREFLVVAEKERQDKKKDSRLNRMG